MNTLNHESVLILRASRAGGKRREYTFYRTILVDERYTVPAYSDEEARALLATEHWRYGEGTEVPSDPMTLCEYLAMGTHDDCAEEFELDEDATEEYDDED